VKKGTVPCDEYKPLQTTITISTLKLTGHTNRKAGDDDIITSYNINTQEKTLAFLLPILELLQPEIQSVQCLILVPRIRGRLQIEQVWKKMGTDYKVNVCYGGHYRY
jgi:hypothetical protein